MQGNSLLLTMRVKCEHDEFEFSVTELRYNEANEPHTPQRNTIEFERVVGRGLDHPLLAVEQEVSFGEGDARFTVEATYDVFHDESEIEYLTGGCERTVKIGEGEKNKVQQIGKNVGDGNNSSKEKGDENDPQQRGLILLRIVTDKGQLKLEE